MIATGKYDWVHSDITHEHFSITGKGAVELELKLIHLEKSMSTDNVLKELDRRGYRLATLPELLAFGAKFPEKQREFPIVALGSVWTISGGDRYVSCLYEGGSGRGLNLDWCDDGWDGFCRFLAVRK